MTALWKVLVEGRPRWASGPPDVGPQTLLDLSFSLDEALAGSDAQSQLQFPPMTSLPVPHTAELIAPVEHQEIWASGVTFPRSLDARNEESPNLAIYDQVYEADRPELFFKSTPERVRGPGQSICIRSDSEWNVPEPELCLVVDAVGTAVAVTAGNDVSSRSIEASNPLYLPQAKIFTGGCAIGPCLLPIRSQESLEDSQITLTVHRAGRVYYRESMQFGRIRRRPGELIQWLFAALEFPQGVFLLTGTSIVPPTDFTLQLNDVVQIDISNLGSLYNTVQLPPGRAEPSRPGTSKGVATE